MNAFEQAVNSFRQFAQNPIGQFGAQVRAVPQIFQQRQENTANANILPNPGMKFVQGGGYSMQVPRNDPRFSNTPTRTAPVVRGTSDTFANPSGKTGPGFDRPMEQPRGAVVASPAPVVRPQASPTVTSGGYGRNPAARKLTIPDSVVSAINTAAQKFGLPPELLYDVAFQESRFNPRALNTDENAVDDNGNPINPTGLFQFTDGTWAGLQGSTGDYGRSLRPLVQNWDRTDPYTNALAAAYLISRGQLSRWNASQDVWGPYYSAQEVQPFYAQTQDYMPGANWRQ